MTLALFAVAVAFGLAGVVAWPRVRRHLHWRRHCLRLAAAHGLSAEQSRWLWRMGRRIAPELPVVVFVRPSVLHDAMASGELSADEHRALHHRLFGASH
ncbi:MAG: hypothetical protein JNK15_25995 [Planctomycetes bacterium]|nr:hypothetical protein [Planctomycetota bacterium]